ncbi:MAG: hypothetical protein HY738_15770 [Bacteroidia bacterium]|nr:hypothetical protein [Bacteroidia bacterium]
MKQFIILINSRLNVCWICLTLVLGIIAYSCNKDRGPKCSSIARIPEEMKSYVMFPEGSYWIYRDSATGVFDSVILKRQEIEIVKYDEESNKCFEEIEQYFYYSFDNLYIRHRGTISSYHNLLGDYFNGDIGDSLSNGLKYIALYDSFYINNTFYFEVKYFYNYSNTTRWNRRSYWVENIGIIKTIRYPSLMPDTLKVFNLIRYFINN